MSKHKGGRRSALPLSISQNYLTSGALIRRLLQKTSLRNTDHVLEIGPGKGHITRHLLPRCRRVTAVEKDAALHTRLAGQFAGEEKLSLCQQDFLHWPLPKGPYKVFANIPFSATSAIVRRLALAKNAPQEMWLTMEKGAAKRAMGKPREGTLSLLVGPFYTVRVAYHFRREDFHPAPGVDVVLLHFAKKTPTDVSAEEIAAYTRFIEGARRRGIHAYLSKKQVSRALREGGFAAEFTPHNALYVQWLCLFRCCRRFAADKLK